MVTLHELIDRVTTRLATLDESRGKWENPLAKLTGREFYALAGVAAFALVLMLLVAWRSGVNAGVGQLPYRAPGSPTNIGGTSAYAPAIQGAQANAAAPEQSASSSQAPSEQATP